MDDKLKLGIPKGSLQNSTIDLFRKSGWKINVNGRSYFPDINDDDIECTLCRAQEMSVYVEKGTLDAGLTGKDWIAENDSDIHVVSDLIYSKVSQKPARWVVAVPKDSPYRTIEDLAGKKIATELLKYSKCFFAEKGIDVDIEFSWGATEAKVVSGLVDAVVEITETESTIRAHNLRVIHEMMETHTQLIANHDAWNNPEKRRKIEQISLLLKGALLAGRLVGIKMNVEKNNLDKIVGLLPSLHAPTVARLYQSDWYAVESVVDSNIVRDLIPMLLANGAEGIIEYPLNKVI